MNTSKRSMRVMVVMAVGAVFLLLALVPLAMAGELPTPQETIQAGQTKVRETQSAGRTSIALTGTAFKSTSVAAQAGAKSTATAYKLTATSLAFSVRATSTAVRANFNAGATKVNATVVAIKTSVKTQLAPITDPAAAIEYYGTNILGISPIEVVSARKATVGDVFRLAQTDVGSQIHRYGMGYAAVSNYGQLSNGYAILSYGLGAVRDEDLAVSLATASSAVYSIDALNVGTLDSASAFVVAQTVFPNLADLTYVPWNTPRGWAWVAKSAEGIADTDSVKAGAGWVMLYVVPIPGGKAAKVSATVELGAFTAFAPK